MLYNEILAEVDNLVLTCEKVSHLLHFLRKLGKKKQRFKLWRQKFLSGLKSVGLDIENVRILNFNKCQNRNDICRM